MDTRTQIRERLEDILNNIPQFAGKVFYDYMYTISENKLPFLTVTTGQETYENISLGRPFVIQKTLQAIISIVGAVKTNYQDELDTYKNLVEKAINIDNTLNGLVQSCVIESITQETDDDRDVALSFQTINLSIVYRVYSNNIDTIL